MQWVGKVQAYCAANGLAVPSENDLDDLACSQFPRYVCDGETQFAHAVVQRSTGGGCGSCGGAR